jgi:hypothetical protein
MEFVTGGFPHKYPLIKSVTFNFNNEILRVCEELFRHKCDVLIFLKENIQS